MKGADLEKVADCLVSGSGGLWICCVLTAEEIQDPAPYPLASTCSKQFVVRIHWHRGLLSGDSSKGSDPISKEIRRSNLFKEV